MTNEMSILFQITCYKRFGPRLGSCVCRIALVTALFATAAVGQPTPRPEFAPVVDDPALPRVLIIGDSISIGYTLPLRAALDGIANVHRPPTNCYERLLARGKPHKVAMVAVMRRLAALLDTLLRQDRLWQAEPPARMLEATA